MGSLWVPDHEGRHAWKAGVLDCDLISSIASEAGGAAGGAVVSCSADGNVRGHRAGPGSSNPAPFPLLQSHSWTTCPPGRKSISTVGADNHAGAGAEWAMWCALLLWAGPLSPPAPPTPQAPLIKLTLVVSSMWLCVRQPAPLLQLCSSALVPTDVPLHIILG